ncbi:MAG: hypothetical protein HY295_01235 [Thaumarchaeota archaeon]|nr:hypothetical protein [Nitrososphaerota archaeon]
MNRIKRISMEVLALHKEKFNTNFVHNKEVLVEVAIIRSKGLKNELAGYITKYLKRELEEEREKEAKAAESAQSAEEAELREEQILN